MSFSKGQKRKSSRVTGRMRRTQGRRTCRSRSSASASATSRSISSPTRRTITPVVAFLQLVGQRRRLLEYLKGKDLSRYRVLIGKLGIRK